MKQLNTSFEGIGEARGDIFTQLEKSDTAYLYERKNIASGHIHYEVFRHKVNERFNTVSYPLSNSFGVWAWSVVSYDKAIEMFKNL